MKQGQSPIYMSLIIAACSNRKRPTAEISAASLSAGTIDAVGGEWFERLAPLPRKPAVELYCGRSVRDVERAAQVIGADLLFASAGLGWVRANEAVPSYGMTVVAGNDNILSRINSPASSAVWWQWLTSNSPFSISLAEVANATDGLVLVALPQPYLVMVEADLLKLPETIRHRLRIVQRRGSVLDGLAPWTLTFDDRLEGSDSHKGTRSDFTARAACYFVEHVLPGREQDDVDAHEAAIQATLSSWTARSMRVGARRSDNELRQIIDQHWDVAGGRTTRLLRILRDDLGIACEQGRFARLVSAMRAERESTQ